MRATSISGAVASGIFPLIAIAFSTAPVCAQDGGRAAVEVAPLPAPGTSETGWTWASLGIDFPEEAAPQKEAPAPYLSASPSKAARDAVASSSAVNGRVSRTSSSDGSSSVTAAGSFKDWNYTEFGVDMSLTARQNANIPTSPASTPSAAEGSGAVAWARTALPALPDFVGWQKGSVDVRVDPVQDQSRLGTTFSRQWTLGDSITASLSDAYNFVVGAGGSEYWETGKTASVKFAQTGTSISVGTASNSQEHGWLPSLSASQNLVGPLVVTTSVANTGDTLNKSITAGFSQKW